MVRALTKSSGIVEREVVAAQKIWGEAIVAIGEAYMREKDYKALAEKVVDTLYGYGKGVVLFSPRWCQKNNFG